MLNCPDVAKSKGIYIYNSYSYIYIFLYDSHVGNTVNFNGVLFLIFEIFLVSLI